MLLSINFTGDGDIADFAAFGGQREEVLGQLGQGFALVVVGFFVNVNVVKVPTAERFEHAFAFGTLDELSQGKAVEGCFAITAFGDEDDLGAVAGHARREGSEPATAW